MRQNGKIQMNLIQDLNLKMLLKIMIDKCLDVLKKLETLKN